MRQRAADLGKNSMGPTPDPVIADSTIPARADVVVIGGGIVGTACALELAEQRISVVLCEKGRIAAEQSSRNWGWVRKMGRDPRELALMLAADHLWDRLQARIGADTGFRRSGIVYACNDSEDVGRYEAWLDHARSYQIDTRLLTAAQMSALYPGMRQECPAGLYTASDARAEPQKVAPAIATAARRSGAVVAERCAVRGVELKSGRVAGVVTERGPIASSAVVLAGGAWSSLFCRNLQIELPQLKVKNSVLRTEPIEGGGLPECALSTGTFAFRKRQDGGYTIADGDANDVDIVPDTFRYIRPFLPALRSEWGKLRLKLGRPFFKEWNAPTRWALDEPSPFERIRVLDPEPNARASSNALNRLAEAFPGFAKAKVAQHWAGMIDVTPDAIPVISAIDKLPGLYIATGFSGHGFGIGPGAGKLVSDLVTGARPVVDPRPFRFSRFEDGSKIEVGGL